MPLLLAWGCGGEEVHQEEPAPSVVAQQTLPLLSAGANNTVRPSFSWVPATTPAATRWVNNVTGSNSSETGSQAFPWRTIAHAVASASAGDVIYVQNTGVPYREHVRLVSVGRADAPIMLVGVPHGTHTGLPEWRDASGVLDHQVRFNSSFWVVKNFIIDKGDSTHNGCVKTSSSAAHNALINVHCRSAHGSPGEHAITTYGTDFLIREVKSYDNVATNCSGNCDLHGFKVGPGSKRIVFDRVEAYNNSGDGLQCTGSEADASLVDPEDIWVENARFHRNHEQAVDIKSCTRVTLAGTDGVDGSKYFGGKDVAGSGVAIVLHFGARNILIEKTRFWDNGGGLNIGAPGHNVHNIVIRRNLFFAMVRDSTNGDKKGHGIRFSQVNGVEVYHNTFQNVPGGAIYAGQASWTGNTANASSNVKVWNNIFSDVGAYHLRIDSGYVPGFSSHHNLFHASLGSNLFSVNGSQISFSQWKSSTGQDTTGSLEGDPMFVDNPRYNDFYTRPGSPARNRALDDSGQPRPCSGTEAPPDLGFKESCSL